MGNNIIQLFMLYIIKLNSRFFTNVPNSVSRIYEFVICTLDKIVQGNLDIDGHIFICVWPLYLSFSHILRQLLFSCFSISHFSSECEWPGVSGVAELNYRALLCINWVREQQLDSLGVFCWKNIPALKVIKKYILAWLKTQVPWKSNGRSC